MRLNTECIHSESLDSFSTHLTVCPAQPKRSLAMYIINSPPISQKEGYGTPGYSLMKLQVCTGHKQRPCIVSRHIPLYNLLIWRCGAQCVAHHVGCLYVC